MAETCDRARTKKSEETQKQAASSEDARDTTMEEFIERAADAYFEACHRLARTISLLKGRRNKR
ncbi:hypothetical protein [Bradymonas sediminis]|uniref:hypothetical protein n=1 Tax=Bradymonas sediminis TaxID=1548548 RepID=UPI00105FB7A1|nr:hypothetical protein [Bradymonas sediminis]TDP62911.1 hypothetical protein DFR33_11144 [Bradymonas sediminis]